MIGAQRGQIRDRQLAAGVGRVADFVGMRSKELERLSVLLMARIEQK